jgi:ribosome biogenesis GTPase
MEEPGCAVRAAIAASDLPAARLASYHKLAAEQQHHLQQQDERARIDEKRRGRIGAKALRKRLKEKGRLRP